MIFFDGKTGLIAESELWDCFLAHQDFPCEMGSGVGMATSSPGIFNHSQLDENLRSSKSD